MTACSGSGTTETPPVSDNNINELGNSVGNIVNKGLAARQGGRIYYNNRSDRHKRYTIKTDGSDRRPVD
jgi:hypothetical protein